MLLVAIGVGMNMGNHVLGQIGAHVPVQPTAVPAATDDPGAPPDEVAGWKRASVMSVATDPGFPDPRVTPEPELPSTPRPRPTPSDLDATPRPAKRSPSARAYTSPPLPLPIVTHSPAPETPGPDIEATPAPAPT